MIKRLPSNEKFIIPMINLDEVSSSALTAMIENAPQYNGRQFKNLIKNTIGAIHQIPHIFEKVNTTDKIDLKNIEAYFGRSSVSADEPGKNIASRFKSHRDNAERKHKFGMIIAKTSIENTLLMERFGINIIETLKKKNGLCIANRTGYSKGGIGENEPGLLYMTFKITTKDDKPANVLTNVQIRAAVNAVMKDLGLDINDDKPVATAAKLAFDAANEVRFIGEQNINLYVPDKNRFLSPDLSQIRFKTVIDI
jgi:hypothetical protein